MEEGKAEQPIAISVSSKIDAYQSGTLVLYTRQLAELTKQFADQPIVTCLATATIVMAAADLEALLSEAAYLIKPELYKKFLYAGMPKKFEMLMGEEASADVAKLRELWEHRKALTHAEPDNHRTRSVGQIINAVGASWAADTVERSTIKIWGAQMPDWFAKTTGLTPESQHTRGASEKDSV